MENYLKSRYINAMDPPMEIMLHGSEMIPMSSLIESSIGRYSSGIGISEGLKACLINFGREKQDLMMVEKVA